MCIRMYDYSCYTLSDEDKHVYSHLYGTSFTAVYIKEFSLTDWPLIRAIADGCMYYESKKTFIC